MEFSRQQSIFQQVADRVEGQIMTGKWVSGERIPSVRELAGNFGVNPNTVMRSYQYMLEQRVLENRRGLGYFVAPGAREILLERHRSHFFQKELPHMFERMSQLEIGWSELSDYYKEHEQRKSE